MTNTHAQRNRASAQLAAIMVIAVASLMLGWLWGSMSAAALAREEGIAEGYGNGLDMGRAMGRNAALIELGRDESSVVEVP